MLCVSCVYQCIKHIYCSWFTLELGQDTVAFAMVDVPRLRYPFGGFEPGGLDLTFWGASPGLISATQREAIHHISRLAMALSRVTGGECHHLQLRHQRLREAWEAAAGFGAEFAGGPREVV